MSTLNIDTNQALFAFNRVNQAFRQVGEEKKTNAPTHDYSGHVAPNRNQPIREDDSTINPVARSISIADRTIETIERHIERMKSPLESIVKNYPPFSPENPERLNYLKSFIGLRREIEQLTLPPDKDAERIVADVKKINVPELTVTSTDKDVAEAIDGLNAASLALNSSRAALADFAATSG